MTKMKNTFEKNAVFSCTSMKNNTNTCRYNLCLGEALNIVTQPVQRNLFKTH